jgi:hypothetical protein
MEYPIYFSAKITFVGRQRLTCQRPDLWVNMDTAGLEMSDNFMSIAEGQKDDVMSMLSNAFQDKIARNMSILHSILKTIYLPYVENKILLLQIQAMCIAVDIIGFRNFGLNTCAKARKCIGHICSPIITLHSETITCLRQFIYRMWKTKYSLTRSHRAETDQIMATHLQNSPPNARYLSPI